jgi:hypothetical protein
MSKERRQDLPRVAGASAATIRIGVREHPCVIENTSPGGAGLVVSAGVFLPQQFDLVVGGHKIPVLLMWRTGDRMGVRYSPTFRGSGQLQRFLTGTAARPD